MDFISAFHAFFIKHLIEVLVLGSFSFMGWAIRRLTKIYEKHLNEKREQVVKESEEQELLKQGVLAILRCEINKLCYEVRDRGYITVEEKRDLDDMMKAYTALGGNGRTHIMYEQIEKLPIN
ncbi:hypothetical protein JDW15_08805 [Aerococcaceae bacterium zg-ZJ1578]|nr:MULTISPECIES: hypothetical protein [unclassified Facklamia]MBK0348714.1 hypothetical protein [Aerococcaceae bacterium zg-1578]MBR7927162.1 hypothetical protein [Aerococcaceae bacterium zg-ZUI334]MBS4462762.1 hypothetical protein [Aerococcaceae bacterium zg-B36]QQD64709.1 hypothetical protein JDW14_05055 [Aerococcaceae bacterium zg-252]NEW63514.1 hypothetical protein [Facklamia sp. 252]